MRMIMRNFQRAFFIGFFLIIPLLSGCVGFHGAGRLRDFHPLISMNESKFQIETMSISPDDRLLAVGYSAYRTEVPGNRDYPVLRIWAIDGETPQLLDVRKVRDVQVQKPEFTSEGKHLIVAEQSGWFKVDMDHIRQQSYESVVSHSSDPVRLLSKSGVYAAMVSKDGTWSITDLSDPEKTLLLPDSIDRVLAFSDSGRLIAAREKTSSGTPRGKEKISIWSILDNSGLSRSITRISTFDIEYYASSEICRFSPDENTLAMVVRTGNLGIWSVSNGKLIDELVHEGKIDAIAFSPTEKKLAVCTSEETASLTLWDLKKSKVLRRDKDRSCRAMNAMVFSRDGKSIYSGDTNGNIKKWPLR